MARAAHILPGLDMASLDRMKPVYANAGVDTRYSCVPADWYETSHGWAVKNRLYLENAVALLEDTALNALKKAGKTCDDIDAIVSVSSTGIATPSLDAILVENLGLRRDTERTPLFGLGCAGGVLGLSRAATQAKADPGKTILLVVVELCGLTFRRADLSKANIVATALFGDGAAAAVIQSGEDGIEFEYSGEYSWPNSLDVMGWRVDEDGLGVIFSRDIPSLTRTEFRNAMAGFLSSHHLTLDNIDQFACHPGGEKVLAALEEAFELPNGALAASRAILREFGNMSAVTVLFVLERLLEEGKRGRYFLSSLGPGFTAAFQTLVV